MHLHIRRRGRIDLLFDLLFTLVYSGRGRGSLYKELFAYFSLFSTSAFDEVGSGSTRKTL